jgi:hypothetical protein
LARLLGFTAENLLRLAVVVAELESRGEDLSDLKIGLLPILRQIAAGTLLPEVVVYYAGKPLAMKRIAALPPAEQRAYVEAKGELEPPLMTAGKPHAGYRSAADTSGPDRPNVAGMAAKGNPRDVGETAAEMILGCSDRCEAWGRLVDQLTTAGAVTRAAADEIRAAMKKPTRKFAAWTPGDD